MRSYGQYCALARALDVIGDRWSPLVVRELLVGPRRYGELLEGLPGIATNLLAERLRHLEALAVIERTADGRYSLTPWGEGLRGPLYELAHWAAPVMMTRPVGNDSFRSDWLAHAVAALFHGTDPLRPQAVIEVRTGDSPMTIESLGGRIEVRTGGHPSADVVVAGPPDAILGVLAGLLDIATAAELGVEATGDARLLRRLRPARSCRVAPVP
jgi:DNA-binding HxlR family transcriptional regulator